ncbi:uncharacterized protein I303_107789 [Kwoniella dejecticola CBS 10117]|uniref:Uncharacterized protein n=1 Tax=Kwoniella dejecticola CBS 10117 TaxID=1296121 RepID=A0A1A5ZVQ5_9TREE|nr:uncharacterized protein I303_07792 [Kwoniella dejecticola CBS 10117]OBR81882.1 hypothetical protein I303_07792 [Kwoniella dejecticola CBS 10117]
MQTPAERISPNSPTTSPSLIAIPLTPTPRRPTTKPFRPPPPIGSIRHESIPPSPASQPLNHSHQPKSAHEVSASACVRPMPTTSHASKQRVSYHHIQNGSLNVGIPPSRALSVAASREPLPSPKDSIRTANPFPILQPRFRTTTCGPLAPTAPSQRFSRSSSAVPTRPTSTAPLSRLHGSPSPAPPVKRLVDTPDFPGYEARNDPFSRSYLPSPSPERPPTASTASSLSDGIATLRQGSGPRPAHEIFLESQKKKIPAGDRILAVLHEFRNENTLYHTQSDTRYKQIEDKLTRVLEGFGELKENHRTLRNDNLELRNDNERLREVVESLKTSLNPSATGQAIQALELKINDMEDGMKSMHSKLDNLPVLLTTQLSTIASGPASANTEALSRLLTHVTSKLDAVDRLTVALKSLKDLPDAVREFAACKSALDTLSIKVKDLASQAGSQSHASPDGPGRPSTLLSTPQSPNFLALPVMNARNALKTSEQRVVAVQSDLKDASAETAVYMPPSRAQTPSGVENLEALATTASSQERLVETFQNMPESQNVNTSSFGMAEFEGLNPTSTTFAALHAGAESFSPPDSLPHVHERPASALFSPEFYTPPLLSSSPARNLAPLSPFSLPKAEPRGESMFDQKSIIDKDNTPGTASSSQTRSSKRAKISPSLDPSDRPVTRSMSNSHRHPIKWSPHSHAPKLSPPIDPSAPTNHSSTATLAGSSTDHAIVISSASPSPPSKGRKLTKKVGVGRSTTNLKSTRQSLSSSKTIPRQFRSSTGAAGHSVVEAKRKYSMRQGSARKLVDSKAKAALTERAQDRGMTSVSTLGSANGRSNVAGKDSAWKGKRKWNAAQDESDSE